MEGRQAPSGPERERHERPDEPAEADRGAQQADPRVAHAEDPEAQHGEVGRQHPADPDLRPQAPR